MKPKGLVSNTITLAGSSFVIRAIGMITIIYLSQKIGAEGMGVYQIVMSIYMSGVVFASSGFTVTISRLISEEIARKAYGNISRIMKSCLTLSVIVSTVITLLLFLNASSVTKYLIKDVRGLSSFKILTLSIPFMSMSSCFKGYFYGMKQMIKPASADIAEQFIKLGLIMYLVGQLAPYGIAMACVGIGIALTCGEIFSWCYLGFLYKRHNRQVSRQAKIIPEENQDRLLVRILKGVMPIALASCVAALLMTTENVLIPTMLRKSGISSTLALSQYGMVKGMLLPLLFFPAAFLTAFSTTLIPEIARAHTAKNRRRVVSLTNRVMHFTFVLGIGVTAIFLSYAHEIAHYIYHNDYLESLIKVLAWIVPVMYIEVIADGILKGLGRQMNSLKYSLADSFLRIGLICLLLPIRGMSGFLMMMVLSNLMTSTLNFNKVITLTQIDIPVRRWLIEPVLGAVIATNVGKSMSRYLLYGMEIGMIRLIIEVGLAVIIYISILIVVRNLPINKSIWKFGMGKNS